MKPRVRLREPTRRHSAEGEESLGACQRGDLVEGRRMAYKRAGELCGGMVVFVDCVGVLYGCVLCCRLCYMFWGCVARCEVVLHVLGLCCTL